MTRPSLRPSSHLASCFAFGWARFARALGVALLAAGVLGLTPALPGVLRAAAAEDGAAEDGADDAAPEAEGIQWISGFEAGRAAAERDGKLMFVYFGRHAPR